jgi:hypothetical protein
MRSAVVSTSVFDRFVAWVVAVRRRLGRIERRGIRSVRRWLADTGNLLHVTVVVFVPLLVALVTVLSNAVRELSFLLFPPLASGTYTLFSDPKGRYADPTQFVTGLTVGAVCGYAGSVATAATGVQPPAVVGVDPLSAGLAVFLTGLVTWLAGVEEPAAYSTALLVLVTDVASPAEYVLSVALSTSIVALAFVVWRDRVYDRRAEYLYGTAGAADRVLVPVGGPEAATVATFGARIAAAHAGGKVVLLDVLADGDPGLESEWGDAPSVEDDWEDGGERRGSGGAGREGRATPPPDGTGEGRSAGDDPVRSAVTRLESLARTVRAACEVPVDVSVARGDRTAATLRTAVETNCDLVVTAYEEAADEASLSGFVRGLFESPIDTVALRTDGTRTAWPRVLVLVVRMGDSAHAMVDFAERLAEPDGHVRLTTCVETEAERRRAESRLANLAETTRMGIETGVSRTPVREYVDANADAYDLLLLGSSGDRSPVSRLLSPPTAASEATTFASLDCDVAVVDRSEA